MNKELNYYEKELSRLELNETMTIIVSDNEGNKTKYLTLNLESIAALKKFLTTLENDLKMLDWFNV